MFDRSAARFASAIAMGWLVAVLAGCATKGFVKQQIASSEAKLMPATEQAASQARDAKTLAQSGDDRARQAQQEAQVARDLALGNVKREEVRKVTVNFAFDSTELPVDEQQVLDGVGADLQANVNYMALISGYTDAQGLDAYNVGLSQRRAETAPQVTTKEPMPAPSTVEAPARTAPSSPICSPGRTKMVSPSSTSAMGTV